MRLQSIVEQASVLPSMKNIVPSDRSGINRDNGSGDRSSIGKSPSSGQSKIWGNLSGQSRGMEGKLDTQGRSNPVMFPSTEKYGTHTPSVYKRQLNEGASGHNSTGSSSGLNKIPAAIGKSTGVNNKYRDQGDIKSLTEAELIGSTISLVASNLFNNR